MVEKEGKRNLLGSIFPPKYDFYGMLTAQAELTRAGVKALNEWLAKEDLSISPQEVEEIEQRADETRRHTEGMLLEAFTTPFDRQDIYSFSRQMDHILNFCLSTAIEMRAFQVSPDVPIASMALNLERGTETVLSATRAMATDPATAIKMIQEMRQAEHDIEIAYVASLARLFSTADPIDAMKKREVYHHLKDAGRALSITIDILHRVIVGQA
jgi:uncharacterized protein Yka (UPF0111/DUF47 family)